MAAFPLLSAVIGESMSPSAPAVPHSLLAQVKFPVKPAGTLPERGIEGLINSLSIAVESTGVTDNYP